MTLPLPSVDRSSRVPAHVQVKEILGEAIRQGKLPPGAELPSTRELGARFNASLISARRAVQSLVGEGYLRREPGGRTIVAPRVIDGGLTGRRFRVAVVLNPSIALENFYHGTILAGIDHAAEAGAALSERHIRRSRSAVELQAVAADGFLVFHPPRDEFGVLERLARQAKVVVIGASRAQTSLDCVDSQNLEGARAAMRHLVGLGHRRIAIVNGPLSAANAYDRYQGYLAELAAAGLPERPEFVFNAKEARTAGSVMGRLVEVMRQPLADRPTAVLACGYYLALDVMSAMRELGIHIPRDLSLIGFDDTRSAALLHPPLSTVRQPLEEMGRRAYTRLMDLLAGRRPLPRIDMVPTSLVLRESAGPAPN